MWERSVNNFDEAMLADKRQKKSLTLDSLSLLIFHQISVQNKFYILIAFECSFPNLLSLDNHTAFRSLAFCIHIFLFIK